MPAAAAGAHVESARRAGRGALLTLFNASDAQRYDLFGDPSDALLVNDGAIAVMFAPRQTVTLTLN